MTERYREELQEYLVSLQEGFDSDSDFDLDSDSDYDSDFDIGLDGDRDLDIDVDFLTQKSLRESFGYMDDGGCSWRKWQLVCSEIRRAPDPVPTSNRMVIWAKPQVPLFQPSTLCRAGTTFNGDAFQVKITPDVVQKSDKKMLKKLVETAYETTFGGQYRVSVDSIVTIVWACDPDSSDEESHGGLSSYKGPSTACRPPHTTILDGLCTCLSPDCRLAHTDEVNHLVGVRCIKQSRPFSGIAPSERLLCGPASVRKAKGWKVPAWLPQYYFNLRHSAQTGNSFKRILELLEKGGPKLQLVFDYDLESKSEQG